MKTTKQSSQHIANLVGWALQQALLDQALNSFAKTLEEEREHKYWKELIEQAGEPK